MDHGNSQAGRRQATEVGGHGSLRFIFSVLVTLCSIVAAMNSPAVATDLSVAVNPAHILVLPGKPLSISVTITNVSDRALTINRQLQFPGPALSLQLTDKDGKRVAMLPPLPPPPLQNTDFVPLAAGEQLTVEIANIDRHLSKSLLPGLYTLSVSYRNDEPGDRFNVRAWAGTVQSNVANIIVTRVRDSKGTGDGNAET